MFGENERIRARQKPLARDAVHRRLVVQDVVGLIPVLRRAGREKIHVFQGDRAAHKALFLVRSTLRHLHLPANIVVRYKLFG